jgi:hypothetical protein
MKAQDQQDTTVKANVSVLDVCLNVVTTRVELLARRTRTH